MASARTSAAVEREVLIDASPEVVWEFFVDPDKQIQWMGRSAELDPRPGGTYRVDINGRDVARGTYLELEPPRRVVFSWGWEGDGGSVGPGESTVEVTLEARDQSTLVRLVHRDLPGEKSRGSHGRGWDHYLPRLASAAAGDHPGADPWGGSDRAGED